MYFAYGWPKVLSTGDAADGQGEAQGDQEIVFLTLDEEYLVLVTSSGIQIWSGGKQRVRLGKLKRSQASLEAEGCHTRAFWSGRRHLLAVVVRRGAP
jgi:hypothetical protein